MERTGTEPDERGPFDGLVGSLAGLVSRTWADSLVRAAAWADRRDAGNGAAHGAAGSGSGPADAPDLDLDLRVRVVSVDEEIADDTGIVRERHQRVDATLTGAGPGAPAAAWAATKAAVGLAASPLTVPALTLAALRTTRINAERIERFPEHLLALAHDREPPLPGTRTLRRPSNERYLITSDLHRCISGRLDWPGRQGVKDLYLAVLEDYAQRGWHLIENGDVEDFWMVGGSTWGAVYDLAYLTGGAVGPGRVDARRRILTEHLDRIVDNNAAIYAMLRDAFCSTGRYHRTMGNHDDVFEDPHLVEHLGRHLPGVEVADTILLSRPDTDATTGIDGVAGIVAHGHLTDSWNGHGYAVLGRYVTWLATGLEDLPGVRKVDALPDEAALERLLGGRARNRLIRVDSRYGGNRRFDSLDEELLFASMADHEARPPQGWPWLVYGHTHFPMLWPLNAAGEPVRYANSGCGVLEGAFSALEWDDSDAEHPLRLIVWRATDDGPRRIELVPDGATLRAV